LQHAARLETIQGADQSVIRPFQFGDIVLIQRMGRQATKLNTVQALLQPQSAFWASFTAIIPWNDAKVTTYVLRQQGHDLVGMGFLQVQKRPGRPELDIVRLAPGLDTPRGHPAIWEKLLSHHNAVATQQQIARIYVDVPDQPLPVHTFSHVGFRTYTRQTIWRLTAFDAIGVIPEPGTGIRPQSRLDEWPLRQLYARMTPEAVQVAEGVHTDQTGAKGAPPPILDWWQVGACSSYVLERRAVRGTELAGAVQIVQGHGGYWLQLWADMYDPNPAVVHQLLRYALAMVRRGPQGGPMGRAVAGARQGPVYIGVCEYHGALGALLSDYGFAPFTDRAKMVKHVLQWVREPALEIAPLREPAAHVVTAHFTLPVRPNAPLRQRTVAKEGVR
jgi:hypothetical protein